MKRRIGSAGAACVVRGATLPLLLVLCAPTHAAGQRATSVDSGRTTHTASEAFHPEFHKWREIILSGVGAGSLATGLLLPVDFRDVPAQGLDPADIPWSLDRSVVGNIDLDAVGASNWTYTAALVFPFVTTLVTGRRGQRWGGFGRRSIVYAEAFLLSHGFTLLAKTTLGRARPFAYLSATGRPTDSAFDVSRQRTFHSMPSGHSSGAWTGATLGMVDHLLSRPDAGWVERAGIGFVGGALAGATSALRVAGGQHFPTDVAVGAALGIATGVAIPLLHRGEQPLPTSEAWLQMLGGAVAGTLVGILVLR